MTEFLLRASPWLDAIGWSLLHSLWQALLLALLFACLRGPLSRAPAGLRVVLGEAALLACLVLPAITAWSMLAASAEPRPLAAALSGWVLPVQQAAEAGRELPLTALLAAGWVLGVALLSLRAALRWRNLRRVVEQAVPVSADWQARFAVLCRSQGIRVAVRWLESAHVAAPILVGWLRPVILFPVGMTVGLPPRQIELLLVHELAHVRRADFLFNLLQLLVETLLFFNPAVRWLSAQVRHERELACDERVAADPRDRTAYARALLAVAEHRHAHGEFAVAATGGVLLERVRRIVGEEDRDPRGSGLRAVIVAAMLAMLLVAGLRAVQPALEAIALAPVERLLGQSLRAVGVEPLRLAPAVPGDALRVEPLRPLPGAFADEPTDAAPLPVLGLERDDALAAEPVLELAEAPLQLAAVVPLEVAPPQPLAPLEYAAPDYPRAARLAGIEGWIELEYRVAPDGRVRAIEVTAAEPAGVFDVAARSAMRRWRFPVEAAGEVRVQRFDFSLGGGEPAAASSNACNRPATGSRVCRRGPLIEDASVSSIDASALRR